MRYKAIVTDVDDTLVASREDAVPSKRVIDVINKAQEKGIIFSIATGRPLQYTLQIIDILHLTHPVIIESGAKLYDPQTKKVLWEALIKSPLARSIVNVLQEYSYQYAVCLHDGKEMFRPKSTEIGDITKIGVFDIPLTEKETFRKKILSLFPVHMAESTSWSGDKTTDFNITDPMGTKQYALLEFAKRLNINTKEIIGIGDHENDYSFLLACGLKVAMGNAIESVKAIADYVSPTIEEDGVADVIEKYILKP